MTRTPCEARPALFELLNAAGVRPSVDQMEGAQYLCVRWCERLAACRADRGNARPEHVWAGLLVSEQGKTYETVGEWRDRSATRHTREARRARAAARQPLERYTHCLACGNALVGDQRMYCSKTHARRASAARHATKIDVAGQVRQLLARETTWRDVSTAARHAVVTQLNAEGRTDAMIAKRFGVSRDAAYNIRRRVLDLPLNPG